MIAFQVKRAGGGWSKTHAWENARGQNDRLLNDVALCTFAPDKGMDQIKSSMTPACGRCKKLAPELFAVPEAKFTQLVAKRK